MKIAAQSKLAQKPHNWRNRITQWVCRLLLLMVIDRVLIPINHYLALGLAVVIVACERADLIMKEKTIVLTPRGEWVLAGLIWLIDLVLFLILKRMFLP